MTFDVSGVNLRSTSANLKRQVTTRSGAMWRQVLAQFRQARIIVAAALLAGHPVCGDSPPGISPQRPAAGPVIPVDGGFMVPYQAQIPGTKIDFEMVPIPGGTFRLGSPAGEPDRESDEGPIVEVRVDPFWMGKYEVTWEQYRSFMELYAVFKQFSRQRQRLVTADNQVDAITAPTPLYDPTFTFPQGEAPRQPAVTMTQYSAKQYTKWLSLASGQFYRLPCEAEWEYACRAGGRGSYFWGEEPEKLDQYAWYFDNSDDTAHDVGAKKPNPFGLYDMVGNVAEMVLDQYASDAYARLQDRASSRPLAVLDTIAPPASLFQRVIRGGGWNSDPPQLRSADRAQTEDWRSEDPNFPKSPWWYTDEEALAVGFRIARPLVAPSVENQREFWDQEVEDLQADVRARVGEGRGIYGLVDPDLPAAQAELESGSRQ